MLTQDDKLILVGLTTLVISERKQIDRAQDGLAAALERCGASKENAETWAGELAYNEGDDSIAAVDRVLDQLDLEVEAA